MRDRREPDFKALLEAAPGLYLVLDPSLRIAVARLLEVLDQFLAEPAAAPAPKAREHSH